MARDYRFEIQYLLSLSVAVLSIITLENLSILIDQRIGYTFLILVSFHFIIFNVTYTYGEAVKMEIKTVEWLRQKSRWTWIAVTVFFLFFIFHVVFSIAFTTFDGWQPSANSCIYITNAIAILPPVGIFWSFFFIHAVDNVCSIFPQILQLPIMSKFLIVYVLPFVCVVAMGAPFRRKIQKPFRTLRDISIKIAPSNLRIFRSVGEGEPLFVKVENEGGSTHEFSLTIVLPEDVVANYEGEEHTGDIVIAGRVYPEGRSPYHINLSYTGEELRSGLVEVEVEHGAGSVEKDIEALLVPQ